MANQPQTPAASNQIDPQVAAIIASIAAGGSQATSDDPPIYYGIAPNVTVRDGRRTTGAVVPVTKPLSEYSKQFYALDKNALIQFQHRAQAAGLYGNSKPRFGDYDDDTYKLWQDVGVRAARFYAAGQQLTVNDVLDMAAQSAPADEQTARMYGTRTDVVNLQDPATIRQAAHEAFKSVSGKGGATNDKKVQKFVETFLSAQLSAQRGVNRAQDRAEAANRDAQAVVDAGGAPVQGPLSQEVDLTMPDLASRASEFAAASDPAGAEATKVADKFGSFLKLLGGVV